MIVAGTDFQDSNDRNVSHYSEFRLPNTIYGVEYLYANNTPSNEKVKFLITPS
jgi:hypothetical protein